MIVQHNISALNANRQLNIVQKTGSKSVEKLSSGYRINRAADDAAGLSISEKMRKQIRGLTKAGENVEDGISLCQVADGAMAEMQDMTNRMNELCVQAANGTNSESDRAYIQMEIDGIVKEFDRIINTTKFNETYVFKNDEDYTPEIIEIIGRVDKGAGGNDIGLSSIPGIEIWTGDSLNDSMPADYSSSPGSGWEVAGTTSPNNGCGWVDFSKFNASSKSDFIRKLDGQGFDSCCGIGCKRNYGIKFVTNENWTDTSPSNNIKYDFHINNTGRGSEVLKINLNDIWSMYKAPNETRTLGEVICASLIEVFKDAGTHPGSIFISHDTSYAYKQGTGKLYIARNSGRGPGTSEFHEVPRDDNGELVTEKIGVIGERVIMPKRQLAVQAGTDTDLVNKISMRLPTMSKESLRLDKLSVLTEDFATDSIEILNDTLKFISEDRSRIGAYQNRLEHTSLNLDNIVENTTDSESKIRDTDMAEEMVRYSNNSILTQAGQSMLSQANNSTQNILSLLSA